MWPRLSGHWPASACRGQRMRTGGSRDWPMTCTSCVSAGLSKLAVWAVTEGHNIGHPVGNDHSRDLTDAQVPAPIGR